MAKLKTSNIIALSIALILLGVLLPIGIADLTDTSDGETTDITEYNSVEIAGDAMDNYTISLTANQSLTIEVDYTYDASHLQLNTTLYNASNHENIDNDIGTDGDDEITWTVLQNGNYIVSVNETTGGDGGNYNLTITIDTWLGWDSNFQTLVGEVMPIVAIIGILVALVPAYRKKYS